MKSIIFFLALIALIGCAKKETATAIIRVTYGTQTNTNEAMFIGTETSVLTSDRFLGHVNAALNLSEAWKLSEDETMAKLRGAVTVQPGNGPGLLVIQATGFDHQTEVNVLNELFNYYTNVCVSETLSVPGKPPITQTVHASIVQPAQ